MSAPEHHWVKYAGENGSLCSCGKQLSAMLCQNCDGQGEVIWDDEEFHHEDLCHICRGSGEIRQHTEHDSPEMVGKFAHTI